MRIEELFESSLSDEAKQKFAQLGSQQRNRPEEAMLRVQHIGGGLGGVIPFLAEHVGDLIHRMTIDAQYGRFGFGEVQEKLEKTLRKLRSSNFEKEIEENLENNAYYLDMDKEELKQELDNRLKDYAMEHDKLTPYNELQWLANKAAISAGFQKWGRVRYYLEELEQYTKSKELWEEKAKEYEPNGYSL